MDESKSDISLDLDVLTPPPIQVKFNGLAIKVTPPSLAHYAKIVDFSQRFQNLVGADGKTDPKTFTETLVIYGDIETFVKDMIPELKASPLNFSQITALFKLLAEIGAPTDKVIEKLKEQGVDLKPEVESPSDSTS